MKLFLLYPNLKSSCKLILRVTRLLKPCFVKPREAHLRILESSIRVVDCKQLETQRGEGHPRLANTKNVSDIGSFHMFSSFYKGFVKDFSALATHSMKLLKKWEESQERAFQVLKDRLTRASILALPNFIKSFELECDASNVAIVAILLQEGHPISYFSENIKDLYALVRALHVWQHYLLPKKFVIHNEHDSLKHLRDQGKLNKRHAKWVEFLEQFPYVIKHKQGKINVMVDALCRKYALIAMFQAKILGDAFILCANLVNGGYFRHDSFLFKEKGLCVPRSSSYEGDLINHFGELKTYEVLIEHFFWPHMKRYIHHICERFLVYRMAKSKSSPHNFYTPLPISTSP
ncbi:Retrovirus-related Pol polyprotein from transposon 17.6, partial [Mucuna pruriens]